MKQLIKSGIFFVIFPTITSFFEDRIKASEFKNFIRHDLFLHNENIFLGNSSFFANGTRIDPLVYLRPCRRIHKKVLTYENGHLKTECKVKTSFCENGLKRNIITLFNGVHFCVSCNPGYVLKKNRCIECRPGQFDTGTKCQKCGINYYQPLSANTSCLRCPAGSVAHHEGSTKCELCAPGSYRIASMHSCYPCPIDTWRKNKNSYY